MQHIALHKQKPARQSYNIKSVRNNLLRHLKVLSHLLLLIKF